MGPLSHTPHLTLHHLHQLQQHSYYLSALHLIVVEAHIIQKFITQLLIHVTTRTFSYKGDSGKFAGILLFVVLRQHQNCRQHLIQKVTI